MRVPTTSEELEMMRKLRAVLNRSSHGLGLAASFVQIFASSKREEERTAVKKILFGIPVEAAFAGIVEDRSLSGELLMFVAALAKMSSSEASRGAERLSSMFDRWTLLKEKRVMERKVMAFRGRLVSVVSGIVVGMLATLAPIISNFQISLGTVQPTTSSFSPYEGVLFLVPSALGLGLFLSPERPYLNVALSVLTFFVVVYFMAPFASFSLS